MFNSIMFDMSGDARAQPFSHDSTDWMDSPLLNGIIVPAGCHWVGVSNLQRKESDVQSNTVAVDWQKAGFNWPWPMRPGASSNSIGSAAASPNAGSSIAMVACHHGNLRLGASLHTPVQRLS
jgi:hypothetical protein